jgi:hypothetical protein
MRCVEPQKRNKDGWRWIVHRFPIRGGISLREAWMRDLMRPNPFLKEFFREQQAPERTAATC